MVKLKRRSALVIALVIANTQQKFLLKTVDPTSSTNFAQLHVTHATVVQTECETNILHLGLALTLSNLHVYY